MSLFSFGSGVLFGTRTDIANATPVQFGTLQEVQIDMQFSNKELYGQYQFPVAVGRGEGKIQGKAKFGRIQGRIFNDLFFGQNMSAAGLVQTALNEMPTVTTDSATVANAATFVADLGVVYAATGLPLQRVATAPATGQYSVDVATGVYSFASADAGAATGNVQISYTYTTSTGGNKISISNQLMGSAPTFSANFAETFQGKQISLVLNACIADKLSLATKTSDFTIPELDFSAFADAAGNIGSLTLNEVS